MKEEYLLNLKALLHSYKPNKISGIVLNSSDFIEIKNLNDGLKIFDIKNNLTEGSYYLDGILLLHSKLAEKGKFYIRLK
jgi:hypothetical protein